MPDPTPPDPATPPPLTPPGRRPLSRKPALAALALTGLLIAFDRLVPSDTSPVDVMLPCTFFGCLAVAGLVDPRLLAALGPRGHEQPMPSRVLGWVIAFGAAALGVWVAFYGTFGPR